MNKFPSDIKDRVTAVCMTHLFLAINGGAVDSKERVDEFTTEALHRYQIDPRFHERVNRMVDSMLDELYPSRE